MEGRQALQGLLMREADDLIISLEDEPFLGDAERTDAGSDLTKVGTSMSQLMAVFWTQVR